MPTDSLREWSAFGISVLVVVVYQLWVNRVGRKRPERVARTVHGQIRSDWAVALAAHPGSEVLAVQTLRNSLMSSTIVASTAALASLGTVSLAGPRLALAELNSDNFSVRSASVLLLLMVLFASFVAAAIAMRYFSHAGYMMGFPVGSPERATVTPIAAAYVRRAGHHYSWSLRLFFFVAPPVVGLLSPIFMPFAAIALVVALRRFDTPPAGRIPGALSD